MTRIPPMLCIAHRIPECHACKAGNDAQREPVAWRFKERVNDEFDTDWILTKYEPADGVRIIAKEPLYTAAGVASTSHALVRWTPRSLSTGVVMDRDMANGQWVEYEDVVRLCAAVNVPRGPLQQAAAGMQALDAGHDPLCMSVLRGNGCTCGVEGKGK